MNSKYTRFFAVFAVALMVMSAAIPLLVCDDINGETKTEYIIKDEYLTDVRNQGSEGICWSFGVAAALETEMLREGLASKEQFMLSPLFLNLQQFDGYEKDYRGGDYNSLYNEGTINTNGGAPYHIIELLSNWKSPIEEYLAPYEEFFVDYYSVDRTLGSCVLVKGIEMLNPVTQATQIKEMIQQNHGAVFYYNASNRVVDTDTGRYAFYTPCIEGSGISHTVQLIGWNDNYPKEKFSGTGSTPSHDGAWLIKNSWGTNPGGELGDGYAWVSYDSIVSSVLFFTSLEKNNGNQNLYSYDHGYSIASDLYRSGNATMANIFTSERNEKLTGVSMSYFGSYWNVYPEVFDQEYVVKVYKLNEGYKNPTDGDLKYTSTSGLANNCGTVYVKFNGAVDLNKGDKFSVCVELKGSKICLPIDTVESSSVGVSHTVAEAGQSLYLSANGNWTDISADGKSNFRIKAYTESNPDGNVATITHGDQVTYCTSLQEAVKNAQKDDIVTLLCSVELTDTLKIENKEFLVIDLSGFTVSVKGKDVVSVTNSTVWITQGKLKSLDGNGSAIVADNSMIDLSRVYLDSAYNCVNAKNNSKMDLHYCTFNNNNADSLVYKLDSDSKVSVERQYLTSSNTPYQLCDTVVDKSLKLNDGDFFGTVIGAKPLLLEGRASTENFFVDREISSEYELGYGVSHVGINTLTYLDINNVPKPMFSLAYAYNLSVKEGRTSCVIELTSDYFTWKTENLFNGKITTSIPVSIELRGHKITSLSDLFGPYFALTITNSSTTKSTIDCASFGFVGNLTIEHNISVITTRSLANMAIEGYVDINISNLSSFYHKNDRGISKEVSVPYSKDGKYCEKVIIEKYEEDRSTITETTVQERTYSTFAQKSSEAPHTYTSITTFADGSTETSVNSSPGIVITTKEDGTVKGTASVILPSGYTLRAELTKDGEGILKMEFKVGYFQKVTLDDAKAIVDGLNAVKDLDTVKQFNCKDTKLVALFRSSSDFEHTFEKAAIEHLANNHVGLTMSCSHFTVSIPCKVLESIHGDMTFEASPMNGSNTSDEITNVIDGKKLAYTVTVKVDGKKMTGKLSENIKVSIPMSVLNKDMKAYLATEDGKLNLLNSTFSATDDNEISFETNTFGTYVICDGLDPDDNKTEESNFVWYAIGFLVVLIVIACILIYIMYRREA